MTVQRLVSEADCLVLEGAHGLRTPVSTGAYKGIVYLPVAFAVRGNHVEVRKELHGVASFFFGNVRGAAFGQALIIIFKLANANDRTNGIVVPMTVKFQFLLLQQLEGNALESLHAFVVLERIGIGLCATEIHHLRPVVGFLAFEFEEVGGGLDKA